MDIKMENNYYNQPVSKLTNPGLTMAVTSLFLGIASLFSMLTIFLPLALGGFAILFALLSKGYAKKMTAQAKAGFICGLAGISVTATIFISSFAMIFSNPDMLVTIGQQYDAVCEDMYGQPAEDIFGFSFEDMMEDYADVLRH